MIVAQLKGWLFSYHTNNNNVKVYERINQRSLDFRNKITKQITDEGIELQEQILEQFEKFKNRYGER